MSLDMLLWFSYEKSDMIYILNELINFVEFDFPLS